QQAKADAQAAVDAIETEYPTAAGKFQDRLDALTDIVLPTVNDENGNGIDDATDLSSVEDLVADAEQAYQDAADALAAAESDNLITPSELATLTQNLADAQQAKADAQAAVDAIETEYPTAAGKFQDRLDALTDIVLPTVNDAIAVNDEVDANINLEHLPITTNITPTSNVAFAVVGLLGANLNLGSPLTQFTVEEGHTQNLTFTVSSGINLGVGQQLSIVLQKYENNEWVAVGNTQDEYSLINLNLLGNNLVGTVTDLPEGQYRVNLGINSAVGLSIFPSVTISGTDTDLGISSDTATGNVLTGDGGATADNVLADTVVSTIKLVGGVAIPVDTDGVNIQGLYGTLNIKADGTYTYTANPKIESLGKTEVFEYTITDPLDINAVNNTATLTINIGSDDVTGVVAAENDTFDLDVNVAKNVLFKEHEQTDVSTVASSTATQSDSGTIQFTLGDVNKGTLGLSNALATSAATTTITYSLKLDGVAIAISGAQGTNTSNVYTVVKTATLSTISASNLFSIDLSSLAAGNYELTYTVTKAAGNILGAATSASQVTAVLDGTSYTYNGEHTDSTSQVIITGNIYADNGVATDTLDTTFTKLLVGGVTIGYNESTTYETAKGYFEVKGNGDYTYTAKAAGDTTNLSADVINYTLISPTGATDSASITINPVLNNSGVVQYSTSGDDTFNTGTGADTVIYDLLSTGTAGGNTSLLGNDTWADYNFNEGDVLDLRGLFSDTSTALTDANIGGFIQVEQSGTDVKVSIDLDGPTFGVSNYTGLVILKNTDVTLQDLLDSNQLIFY
ncbi:BapA/Bap/LapF family large adhesin, partial [Acinetobacter sp. YH12145]|uniref:BapA/Bap/LapF family large adhesin n=1 Tax=Acinetobacter sp. YH12145 TaxID=2601129 RepID=UPI0015D3E488